MQVSIRSSEPVVTNPDFILLDFTTACLQSYQPGKLQERSGSYAIASKFLAYRSLLLVFCLVFPGLLQAMDLPGRLSLKQNDKGEYYVVNAQNITMIEPSIIAIGFSKKWVLACISNLAIDSDDKRMVFIDLRNQGATDTINRENWERFRVLFPELDNINLEKLQDTDCP